MTLEKSGAFDTVAQKLGVLSSSWSNKVAESIVPAAGFMLGGGQRYELSDPFESALGVRLRDDATVYAVTGDEGVPLVWSTELGKGRIVVDNIGVYDKVMRGFYAASYSLLGDACAYPVLNSAVFFLDDFPSPVPEGDGQYIRQQYGLSIAEFYTKVWWPDLVRLAERYGIRYTGVMIENYGDDTEAPPTRQRNIRQFQYYGGLLACLGGSDRHRPVLLTEHGIYTREREEEIIRAEWVAPDFKARWTRFFHMLSEQIYRQADRVTSLFTRARSIQIGMGCEPGKCIVIPNGVDYEKFCAIPPKAEDGWVDIGAVVRLAPIKDIKTLLYAFLELSARCKNVRLHILGGVDDEEYARECYALAEQLGLENIRFTGRVDIAAYLQKLDFTILTSISEGQPLSVLESLAARRPCVTTDVGCCRELLEGTPGDTLGAAGFCVPPMYRQGLADAMEKLCVSRPLRQRMGAIGQQRVAQSYRYEQMLARYRALYAETAATAQKEKETESEELWLELGSN